MLLFWMQVVCYAISMLYCYLCSILFHMLNLSSCNCLNISINESVRHLLGYGIFLSSFLSFYLPWCAQFSSCTQHENLILFNRYRLSLFSRWKQRGMYATCLWIVQLLLVLSKVDPVFIYIPEFYLETLVLLPSFYLCNGTSILFHLPDQSKSFY